MADPKTLPEDALRKYAKLLERAKELTEVEKARENFLDFVKYIWPNFIAGRHHEIMAREFEAIARGEKRRLIINLPPRHSKSEFASYLFPAWYIGRMSDKKIMQATHTADLSIRFGRKIKNLMESEEYKKVFPDTKLRSDSKAAYRWETDEGGEYYACLTPDSLVHTVHGPRRADSIQVGDRLLNCGKPVTVQKVYAHNVHDATVTVAGLSCSKDHPIWTMNRGWVYAGQLKSNDILCVPNTLDTLKALVRRLHGYLEHADVPQVVQHQVALRKPAQRKVAPVRWARDLCVRALAGLREFFGGHGTTAHAFPYGWADRQQWALQPGKLPVGDPCSASQQQAHEYRHWGENNGGACEGAGGYPGNNSVPHSAWAGPSPEGEAAQEELRAYGPPEKLGWVRRAGAQILACRRGAVSQSDVGVKGYLEGFERAAQKICGLLLGVRPVGGFRIDEHEPRSFINFLTDGDHTFFADGVLTHNCGVGGNIAGRGADLFIVDDPHSEQDAQSPTALENAWDWYQAGPRQRLQPGGAIIVVMTRWGELDLTARLVKQQGFDPKADQWEVIEFPAILPSGQPLWPEYWKLEELEKVKASIALSKWQAQYMQQPTSDAVSIVKRDWWRKWEKEEIPRLHYVMQSYDTAFLKTRTADFSAIQTWGVFYPQEDGPPNLILLDAKKGRWEFPDLKRIAFSEYQYWDPETVLIESKAAGLPLTQELRSMGIPVVNYTPSRGNDKFSRLNSVAPLFEAGLVWYPETSWAEEVIEEIAAFPYGEHDDYADCASQALMRFRQGGFITHPEDYVIERTEHVGRRVYY